MWTFMMWSFQRNTYTHDAGCEFTCPSTNCCILDLILWYSSLLKHVRCIEINLKEKQWKYDNESRLWAVIKLQISRLWKHLYTESLCKLKRASTRSKALKHEKTSFPATRMCPSRVFVHCVLCKDAWSPSELLMGHLIFPNHSTSDPVPAPSGSFTLILLGRVNNVSSSSKVMTSSQTGGFSHRIIAAELHGTADDDDRNELPAYGAVGEQIPRSAGSHSSDFRLFLQDLVKLAALDLAAPQPSQSWAGEESQSMSALTMCLHDGGI